MYKIFVLFSLLPFPTFAKVTEVMRPPFYERCVKSICGEKWESAEDILRKNRPATSKAGDSDEMVLTALGDEVQSNLAQVLAKLELLIKKEREDFVEKYALLHTLPTVDEIALLTPEQKMMLSATLFISSSNAQLLSGVNAHKKEALFNKENIQKLAQNLGNPLFSEIIERVLPYMNPYRAMEIWGSPEATEAFLHERYPEKNFSEATEILFSEYQKVAASLSLRYPWFLEENSGEKNKPQNNIEIQNLAVEFLVLVETDKLLQDQIIKEKIQHFDFAKLFHGYVALMGGKDAIEKLQNRITESALSEAESDAKMYLRIFFERSFPILPQTLAKKNQLKEKSIEILQDIVKKIEKFFPHEPDLYRLLHEIQLVFPPTQLEYTQQLIAEMTTEETQEKSTRTKNELVLQKMLAFSILQKMDSINLELFLPKASHILFDKGISNYAAINDWAAGKQVLVSLISLYSDYGAAILAHEVGHVVDSHRDLLTQLENQRRYKEIRACLIGLHPEQAETTEISFHGESMHQGFYAKEDFADLISAKVLEKRKNVNIGCGLIDSMRPNPLLNGDVSDPHSSNLYRILHSEIVKSGTISPQCKEYVQNFEKNETARRIENCWK